jgi:hypothetical protein
MRFHTAEQFGPRQAVLPSGTLWCRDVVIARLGPRHDSVGSEIRRANRKRRIARWGT